MKIYSWNVRFLSYYFLVPTCRQNKSSLCSWLFRIYFEYIYRQWS